MLTTCIPQGAVDSLYQYLLESKFILAGKNAPTIKSRAPTHPG